MSTFRGVSIITLRVLRLQASRSLRSFRIRKREIQEGLISRVLPIPFQNILWKNPEGLRFTQKNAQKALSTGEVYFRRLRSVLRACEQGWGAQGLHSQTSRINGQNEFWAEISPNFLDSRSFCDFLGNSSDENIF